jgi:hypothetical protein
MIPRARFLFLSLVFNAPRDYNRPFCAISTGARCDGDARHGHHESGGLSVAQKKNDQGLKTN